jgi:hypothetical protein
MYERIHELGKGQSEEEGEGAWKEKLEQGRAGRAARQDRIKSDWR